MPEDEDYICGSAKGVVTGRLNTLLLLWVTESGEITSPVPFRGTLLHVVNSQKKWRKRKTNVTIRSNNCLFIYHARNERSNRSALFLLGGENFSFPWHLHEFHAAKFDIIQKGTNRFPRTIERLIFSAELNNKKIRHFPCLFIFSSCCFCWCRYYYYYYYYYY